MEQHEQHHPRLYQEQEIMKAIRPGPADSPPPNCAICLGTCTNKCFTDCCLHQFCFNCLLEWSKIKAECPLCKQPFKSIIYNIKSNLEYEEHIITNPEREVQGEDLLLDEDVHTEYLFLPNGPRPQRHFQFRTTLTLEPGREFAIQQLLLSHPRTNSIYLPTERFHNHRYPYTIHQRRDIYREDLWVVPEPDITGRYRECTRSFFRENPAQTHRIIPWLNRELAAVMVDYINMFHVQERIIEMLCQYPIQSASFRSRIVHYLGARTDHFIHEFYNFVRSPYDMIGYDRHMTYSHRRPPTVVSQTVSDDDSDVRVVDSPPNGDCIYVPPAPTEVIVINSDSSSDSDVIIRSPIPPPTPPIVDLVDSDSDEVTVSNQPTAVEPDRPESSRSPQLPIKMRLKLNRNNPDMYKISKHKDKRISKMKRYASDSDSDSYHPKSESEYSTAHISTSSNCESSDDQSDSSSVASDDSRVTVKPEIKHVQSLILKRSKVKLKNGRKHRNESKYTYKSSSKRRTRKTSVETKDASPERTYKLKKSKKSKKQKKSKRKANDCKNKRFKRIKMERSNSSNSDRNMTSDSDEEYYNKRRKLSSSVKKESPCSNNEQTSPALRREATNSPSPSTSGDTEAKDFSSGTGSSAQDLGVAGPSHVPSLRSVIVKGNHMWYSRPDLDEQSTDNNSD